MKNLVLLLFISVVSLISFGQEGPPPNPIIDSLKEVVATATHDSTKLSALMEWQAIEQRQNPPLAYEINKDADSICEIHLSRKISEADYAFYLKSKATAVSNLGTSFYYRGGLDSALKYYEQSVVLFKETGIKERISAVTNNIGIIAHNQGDFAKAISSYTSCLTMAEEAKNVPDIAQALTSIGMAYRGQLEFETALEYYDRSLNLIKDLDHPDLEAAALGNAGVAYKDLGRFDEALDAYYQALALSTQIGDQFSAALTSGNIAEAYLLTGQLDSAMVKFPIILEFFQMIGEKRGIANTLTHIATIHQLKGEYGKAIELGQDALRIANEAGGIEESRGAAEVLSNSYRGAKKYADALEMYELVVSLTDSIESESNQRELYKQEYKHSYEKQALADSIVEAEKDKVQTAESERNAARATQQEQLSYFLYGGLALLAIFGIFIFNRLRVTRKQRDVIDGQKKVVEEQKEEVEEQKAQIDEAFHQLEEKNTEIMDSINYARRIQTAILPPNKLVKQYLDNSFVLYKPKDIVAGDFYWLEPLEDRILFAAADCTGHGVPGAMVSVVCNNGLNRSVREHKLVEPGDILSKTREIVISEFEKSEEEVKDGMDVALCCLQGKKLKYAGANNPLWIVRKGGQEVEEVKAHKQPIGKYMEPTPYPTHEIELNEGDSFYIFSDGFADQFGGEKGKKFKSANFKRLLVSVNAEPMIKQCELIDAKFEEWKGEIEQLDDVCVIGVRV